MEDIEASEQVLNAVNLDQPGEGEDAAQSWIMVESPTEAPAEAKEERR